MNERATLGNGNVSGLCGARIVNAVQKGGGRTLYLEPG